MPVLTVDGTLVPRSRLAHVRHPNKAKRTKKNRAPRFVIRRVESLPKLSKKLQRGRQRDFQLYALELVVGNFYVGLTAYRDVQRRYEQHVAKRRGAQWTALHPPVRVIETRPIGFMYENEAVNLETLMTLEYMEMHGVAKVRGGNLCSPKEAVIARAYKKFVRKIEKQSQANSER